MRQKGSQRRLRQRKLTERFEGRCNQNPRSRTAAHSPKGSEIPEKEN